MLLVREIIGCAGEPRFAGRAVEHVDVAWDEAGKRRLRRAGEAGTDVAIDLERGSYLADGAVLHDDGARILVVRRRPEPALAVRFDTTAPPEQLVSEALRLGHAFGNQHVPLDVDGAATYVPLTTSEAVARATVEALDLRSVDVAVVSAALGRRRPLPIGHGHGHGSHA